MLRGFRRLRGRQVGLVVGLAAGADHRVAVVVVLAATLAPDLLQGVVRLGRARTRIRAAAAPALLLADLVRVAVLERASVVPVVHRRLQSDVDGEPATTGEGCGQA